MRSSSGRPDGAYTFAIEITRRRLHSIRRRLAASSPRSLRRASSRSCLALSSAPLPIWRTYVRSTSTAGPPRSSSSYSASASGSSSSASALFGASSTTTSSSSATSRRCGVVTTGSSSISSAETAMSLSSPARGMTVRRVALHAPLIGRSRPKLEDFPLTDCRDATKNRLGVLEGGRDDARADHAASLVVERCGLPRGHAVDGLFEHQAKARRAPLDARGDGGRVPAQLGVHARRPLLDLRFA